MKKQLLKDKVRSKKQYKKPVVEKVEFNKEEAVTLIHASPSKQTCLYPGS